MIRCSWCNENNDLYIKYHDEEWGLPLKDDKKLFALLILEQFQAGLSWECILNKRENFYGALDNFDILKISSYNQQKIEELLNNKGIIRNKRKILAMIQNAKVLLNIQKEYGSFSTFLWAFTNNEVIYETGLTHSILSDKISKELKDRGMSFVGTTIIYSFLQAAGIINSHEKCCFKYMKVT